jgi:hypothetical protein
VRVREHESVSNWRFNWQFPRRVSAAYRPHAPVTYHSFVCSHASRCAARGALGAPWASPRPPAPCPPTPLIRHSCFSLHPAHASLRRAGPQNAQIGAPVRAPEPGPLVETGQDWSRLGKTAPAMSLPKEPGRNVMLSTPASTYHCARATTQTGSRRTNTSSVMREQCRLRAVARVGPVSSHQRLCAH